MNDTAEELSLNEVADRLGVHYMTAYRYVRLGMLPARREGRTWRIRLSDVDAFGAEDQPRTPRGEADWEGRFLNRLLAADEAGAFSVVEAALSSGMTVPEVYSDLLVPVLRRVGDSWAAGEIDVANEHVASHVAARIIGRLGPRLTRRGRRRGTVVIGSTATEMHSLPLAIMADLLRAEGFEVVDLGAFLPPDSFADAVASSDGVVAIGIGVTAPGQAEQLGETLAAVRAVSTAPVIIGGGGVDEEMVGRLGGDGWARSANDAVLVFEKLIANSDH